jgi:hypothetical protein
MKICNYLATSQKLGPHSGRCIMKGFISLATKLLAMTLASVLLVVPAIAASAELPHTGGGPSMARAETASVHAAPATFHAFSRLPSKERAALVPMTDDELASIEGEQVTVTGMAPPITLPTAVGPVTITPRDSMNPGATVTWNGISATFP